ncbi:MAG: hypothetical protein JST54_16980 [Deltaproteobacteria bacterium]|nr:hypothetical protein [Deltaproteobacteria bacterium]
MRPSTSSPGSLLLLVTLLAPLAAHADVKPVDERVQLRAQLKQHREEQLSRLQAYADAGEFPVNPRVTPSAHLFRDANGHYCAVANLVHRDGEDALVADVVKTRNDLVVSDVHDGPMMAWILNSGLTQEELARIQAPAPFVEKPAAVDPMIASIRAHLKEVRAELLRNEEKSLDLAVDRLMASHRRTQAAGC